MDKAIEDIQNAMKGLFKPVFKEVELGRISVRNTFKVSGVGTIAGAYVQDGKVGFNGPLNTFVEPKSSNYYMEAWFGEQTLTGRINTIAIVLMVVMLGGLL